MITEGQWTKLITRWSETTEGDRDRKIVIYMIARTIIKDAGVPFGQRETDSERFGRWCEVIGIDAAFMREQIARARNHFDDLNAKAAKPPLPAKQNLTRRKPSTERKRNESRHQGAVGRGAQVGGV